MENKPTYELTNPQKSIWLTEEYFKGYPINNICGSIIINQEVDLNVLNTAINYFIKNNDSFKLRFKQEDGQLLQYFTEDEEYKFDVINIDDESQIDNIAKKMVNTQFDLFNSHTFDFKIIKLPSGFGGVIGNIHHLISDAATFSIIATEIIKIYSKLLKNETISTKTYSYKDYINSEKEYLSSNRFEKDKEYWNELLTPLPEVATVPNFNNSQNEDTSLKATRSEFVIDNSLLDKIKKYCSENNVSIFIFLISVYSLYLGRINNLEQFLIGTPILNRTNFAEKHTSGMFISTSLLKIDLSTNYKFSDFIHNNAKSSISMLRHQKYNYQYIIEDIRKKDNSIANLYDIILSYQVTKATDNSLDIPYSSKWYNTDYISNTLNIHFHDTDDTGKLFVEYDYKTSKLSEDDIEKMHNRVLCIIEQVLENNTLLIDDIDIVTPSEKNELLNVFNTKEVNYSKNKDIIELFKDVVQKNPNQTALFFEGRKVSYIELDTLSDNLADYLSRFNINYEDRIAIFLDKSIEMIVSILAILKVNAAFLPIDIDYPEDRINYILKDANVKIALTNSNLKEKITNLCNSIYLDTLSFEGKSNFKYTSKPFSSLAYVMYTSGSTGRPKGVMIEQQSIVRLAIKPNFIKFGNSERILQTGSIVFDACTFEIWAALLNGFTLYILEKKDLLNPTFLGNYLTQNKISILWITAPLFNQLSDINPYMFSSVKYLLTGGDVLSPKHINKVIENNLNLQIINGYGPTENTTFSCCFNIDKKYLNKIPIGYPVSGTTCYVVSKTGSLQPIGVPGELWVGGDGVSRGYLNRDDLTKERFIDNPFDETSKIYKTGDLVRWNPNGTIDFIGRIDGQVKIRGFRVELNEINNTLLMYPNVKNSATIIKNINDTKEICSYIIPSGELDIEKLKDFLKTYLPTYMIPKYFMIMNSFPLNVNGKIDKAKLPVPTLEIKNEKIIEPQSTFELEIYKMVKDLVPSKTISVNDNFFNDLGLDSLNAMQLCSALYKYDISIQDISDYPTIKLLAEMIEKHIKISHFENNLPKINIKNQNFEFDLTSVLLTGSLGFLGMHILQKLLLCNNVKKVYCLIRNKGNSKYTTRFYKSLEYYFGNTLDELVEKKVELICGNFANSNLELSDDQYESLAEKINTVIHCGANVKHYGNFQKFNQSNVIGTQNIIEFCKKSNAKLAHISTISVSGYEKNGENFVLSENDFNIGQTFNNHVYMITKYLAEYHVLSAINNNQINAKIFRVGNIMPRYSDNVFQFNEKDNAMLSRLRTIVTLKEITESYDKLHIDFSPVDLCADAIMKILQNLSEQSIYHIYNNNSVLIKDFINLANIKINYVSEKKFINDIQDLNNPLAYHILNDIQHSNKIIPVVNNLTTNILNNKGFYWNKIDQKYIDTLKKFI